MDIRLVGGVDDGSRPQSNRLSSANGGGMNQRVGNRANNQQNGTRGGGGGGRGGRGGRQQQNGAGAKKEVSADDLDAELDAYRAESKQKKQ